MNTKPKLQFHPATPDRWMDLEMLFGQRGACGGCWCMAWRRSRADFNKGKGTGNKNSLRRIVRNGDEPGILAYDGDLPIGWCAVAPRSVYITLERSRVLRPIDDQPVWSISCIFVAKPYRRSGVSIRLLKEAVRFAKRHGARMVEGYPVVPYTDSMPAAFAWTGVLAAFEKAGFKEAARRSTARPIMRKRAR